MNRKNSCVALGIVIGFGVSHGALYSQCMGLAHKLNSGTVPDFRSLEGCQDGAVTTEISVAAANLVKRAYDGSDVATLKKIAQLMRQMFALYRLSTLQSQQLITGFRTGLKQQGIAALKLLDVPPDGREAGIEPLASAIESLQPAPAKDTASTPPAAGKLGGASGSANAATAHGTGSGAQNSGVLDNRPAVPSTPIGLDLVRGVLETFSLLLLLALVAFPAWVHLSLRREIEARSRFEEATGKRLTELDMQLAMNQTGRTRTEIAKLDGLVTGLQEQVNRLVVRGAGPGIPPAGPPAGGDPAPSTLMRLYDELHWLREKVNKVATPDAVRAWMEVEVRNQLQRQRRPDTPPPSATEERETEKGISLVDLLELELASLRAGWERYRDQQPQLVSLAESATGDSRMELRSTLLIDLPRAIASDEPLRVACESLLEPVKDFYNFSVRVAQIPALLQVDLQRLRQEPGKFLMATRERAQTLAILSDGRSGSDRLRFDVEKWVREQFVPFADLFLQTYQQARLDGSLAPLEEARAVVGRILAAAKLEPVEIVLGQTPFDSTRHIARLTASRATMRDHSIAGVLRNGFQQVGGPVVQQPEVIVNRL